MSKEMNTARMSDPELRARVAVLQDSIESLCDELAAASDRYARTLRVLWQSRRAAQEQIDRLRSGGKTLGQSLVALNQIALDATDMHDVINENGDGDWQAVWENVSDLGEDLRAARKRVAEVEAERDAAVSIARSNSHALDKAQAEMETTAIELLAAHRRIAELEATQRHRLVETAEELDALPIGSVVLTIESRTAWENIAESVSLWANCGAALTAANLLHNYGAVIVVWTPELEAQVQR